MWITIPDIQIKMKTRYLFHLLLLEFKSWKILKCNRLRNTFAMLPHQKKMFSWELLRKKSQSMNIIIMYSVTCERFRILQNRERVQSISLKFTRAMLFQGLEIFVSKSVYHRLFNRHSRF